MKKILIITILVINSIKTSNKSKKNDKYIDRSIEKFQKSLSNSNPKAEVKDFVKNEEFELAESEKSEHSILNLQKSYSEDFFEKIRNEKSNNFNEEFELAESEKSEHSILNLQKSYSEDFFELYRYKNLENSIPNLKKNYSENFNDNFNSKKNMKTSFEFDESKNS